MVFEINVSIFSERKEVSGWLEMILRKASDIHVVGVFSNKKRLRNHMKTTDVIFIDFRFITDFRTIVMPLRETEIRAELIAITNTEIECITALINGAIGCIQQNAPVKDCLNAVYQAHYGLVILSAKEASSVNAIIAAHQSYISPIQQRILDQIAQGVDYATIAQQEFLPGEDSVQGHMYNLLHTLHQKSHGW